MLITGVSQKSCNILVVHETQFDSFRCFYQGHEVDEPYCTMRHQAHLILSECYSIYLPQ